MCNSRTKIKHFEPDIEEAVIRVKTRNGCIESRSIACAAYFDTIYSLFGLNRDHKYRIYSTLISNGDEEVFMCCPLGNAALGGAEPLLPMPRRVLKHCVAVWATVYMNDLLWSGYWSR